MNFNLIKKALCFNVLFLLLVQACAIAQPEQNDNSDDAIVCVTKTGDKYHLCSCRYLSKSSYEMNLSDAQKRYDACSVCKPGKFKIQGTTTTRRTVELESEYTDDYSTDPSKDDNEVSAPRNTVTKKSPSPANAGAASQCSATTKSTGQRCSRRTTNASGKCFQHDR